MCAPTIYRTNFDMEVVTLASRLQQITAEHHIERISLLIDRQYRGHAHNYPNATNVDGMDMGIEMYEMSFVRRFFLTWGMLYVSSVLLYFFVSSVHYLVFFRRHIPEKERKKTEMMREIRLSLKSLILMTLLSTPTEILSQLGYTLIYHDKYQYGALYLVISPVIFVMFSDFLIYFIHRGLHHPRLYKYLHKPHHSFIHTTPFAAFAFHPLDGWLQGLPYHIFTFIAPMHGVIHLVSLMAVSWWTINIHDQVSVGIPGINGAEHHTIHHTTFRSNYGQYTIIWDTFFRTYKDPKQWKAAGEKTFTEKQVYGKDA